MPKTKISKAAKDFNVSIATVVEFLQKKGISIDNNPNTKIDESAYDLLVMEYAPDRALKNKSEEMTTSRKSVEKPEEEVIPTPAPAAEPRPTIGPKVIGKIDLDNLGHSEPAKTEPKKEEPKKEEVKVEVKVEVKEEPKVEAKPEKKE